MPISIPKAPKKKTIAPRKRIKKMTTQLPSGMRDLIGEEVERYDTLWNTLKSVSSCFGFIPVRPSMVEEARLYERLYQGQIRNHIYSVLPQKKVVLGLRPLMLPGIMRAYNQYRLARTYNPGKFYYMGWVWGRKRTKKDSGQISLGGLEVLNAPDPVYDAQVVTTAFLFAQKLKLNPLTLKIHSSGCNICRKTYIKKLKAYYRGNTGTLCSGCVSAYRKGSMKLLACQKNGCQEKKESAPVFLDHLCPLCRAHFKRVLEYLDEMETPYLVDPYLVRDSSISSRTIFELYGNDGEVLIGKGGRHDALSPLLTGPRMPSVGFEFFGDVLVEQMKKNAKKNSSDLVFLLHMGEEAKRRALSLIKELHDTHIPVRELFSKTSLNAQLTSARKEGAKIVLILGQREVFEEVVIIRDLSSGIQETIPLARVVKEVRRRLK